MFPVCDLSRFCWATSLRLDPHLSYYQRLLALDQDEALRVALEEARVNGAESVYDEVFLPALVLARRDRHHGGLAPKEETVILQSTIDILKAFDAATSPAPSDGSSKNGAEEPREGPSKEQAPCVKALVLGCPAHDEAEELSLLMLGYLMKVDNCRLEAVSTRTLPAEIEEQIEAQNPALLFIAILPPGGVIQTTYLCKRMRKRFRELPILVGYWGDDRHYDRLLVRLRAAGASSVTTSLLQARSHIRALMKTVPLATGAPVTNPSGAE